MIVAFVLAQALAWERPWCDADDQATEHAAAQEHGAELWIRSLLLQRDDASSADRYNLAAALRDAGYPVVSWFEEIAAATPPWDPVLQYTLDVLAEDSADPAQRSAAEQHADYLREVFDGRTATQGHSPRPSSSSPAATAEGPDG